MKKIANIIIIILVITSLLSGCDNTVEIVPEPNTPNSSTPIIESPNPSSVAGAVDEYIPVEFINARLCIIEY